MGWHPECWRWVEGYHFLNYNTKFGRDFAINRVHGMARAVEKWQVSFIITTSLLVTSLGSGEVRERGCIRLVDMA